MKSFKLNYIYDYDNDLADITVNNDFRYKKSIELDKGIILDLDENCIPIAIELISASKILCIDKKHLISPDINILIKVNNELIKFEIKFTYFIHEDECDIFIKQNIANNYGIPSIETLLTTV